MPSTDQPTYTATASLDPDVQHAGLLRPSAYLRSKGDADLVLFEPMIARHVLRGDMPAAASAALELALWRDSQMTATELAAYFESMRTDAA